MPGKKCPKCSEVSGELSSRCWQCGTRFNTSRELNFSHLFGPAIGAVVVIGVFACVGLFVLKVKKDTMVLLRKKPPIDQVAAQALAALQDTHEAVQLNGSYQLYVSKVKVAKAAVKQYMATHDKESQLSKDISWLLVCDMAIQGLWERKLKHEGLGLSSDNPAQKAVLDSMLEKMPEVRDIVVVKRGLNGQMSAYCLPYDVTIGADWKRSAIILDRARKEVQLPTVPALAAEGNVLYRPSRTLKHPTDNRNPFTPRAR